MTARPSLNSHRDMSASWSVPLRSAVTGTVVLGIVLVAWMTAPEKWLSLQPSSDATSTDRDEPVHFVYPTSPLELTDQYRERAESWASFWGRRQEVHVVPATDVAEGDLAHGLALVAGTPESALIARLLTERGISVRTDGAFVVGGHVYDDSTDVLLFRGIPPEEGDPDWGRGIRVAVGQSDAAVLSYAYANPFLLQGLPAEYKIIRDGRLLAYGQLSETPSRRAGACTVPAHPAHHIDVRPGSSPTVETEHFRFFAHGGFDSSSVKAFATHRTSTREAVQPPQTGAAPPAKTDYHLFERHADVRHFRASVPAVGSNVQAWLRSNAGFGRPMPAQGVRVDSTSGALSAVLPKDPESISPTEAQRWMQANPDGASTPWRAMVDVGRVARAQGTVWDRSMDAWTARLHAADVVPSLSALAFDTTLAYESSYAQLPIGATMVSFLERHADEATLRSRPSRDALQRLGPAWQQHLDSLGAEHGPLSPSPASLPDDLYGANVAFATGPAWGSPQGYASRAGDAALSALHDLGASAAAIVPYTPMPTADAPVPLLRRRHAGGSQSDATIAHAIRQAHDLGLDVLLKPQISGDVGWPGRIDMPSETAWDTFFDRYADWMLHYALMAERHDVEVLSIGTELVEATRNHETEWRRLIERVRAVFDGAVVYAANWGDEAERLSFGDALDAVGIDSYYPLSDDPDATNAQLVKGAESVARRIENVADRTGRPVLLTEMGFPNTEGAWVRPHKKREDKPERPEHQARATEALTTALSETSIRGAFWWRWSPICRFDYGRFPPTEPTRAVLKEWFQRAAGPAHVP